jgi:hypothetical protein
LDEDSEADKIRPKLLGQFDQKPHGLVSKMNSGETIVVHVPDTKNPPESLRSLLGASPWAIINGELTLLKGRVVLKSSSDLPAKTAEENEPANASDLTDLKSHGKAYLTCVQSQLDTHRYVAVHGDAACGKSHLSRQLKKSYFLGDIGQATTPNDIQADPAFKKWLESGKSHKSVLVIDEYNLAETGVFDCLKGTHIHLNGELIELTNNHKVLFLGNKATETGRNNHPNLIDSIVTMQSPDPEWVVNYCRSSSSSSSINISEELKSQLIAKVNESASIRDIQTFFAMYQLNKKTAHAMVFTPEISVTALKPTINGFLDYVDQKPTGNRVLYITGEPGCGKDHSIKEALREKSIQHECVTLGQHMDIDQFKQMFDTAYANGTVLVVSELSAAPSAVLEYMNDKLAKKADNKFCLIATDNAGFEGREPLSGPLRSRCVCKTIQPVTRNEFDKLFDKVYSKELVDFHFSLEPGTVSLRQLHRAGKWMKTDNKGDLVDVIREVYGETLANQFINAQQKTQAASSSGIPSGGSQQPPQGVSSGPQQPAPAGSSGSSGAQNQPQGVSSGPQQPTPAGSSDPETRELYAESNQPIDPPSIAGTCDDVSNGFLIKSVYDDSGQKVASIVPFIASSDNSPIPIEATIKWGTQDNTYSVVNQQEPVVSDAKSLDDLLNLNIQDRDEYAKKVAGFIRNHYKYSIDCQTTNSVKKVLEKWIDSADSVSNLSSVVSLNCDTATLLFIQIMKHKFPGFNIYYGTGFRIIHGKVSGTGHAQPIWQTHGGTTTIDPTPVNASKDKATQEFCKDRAALFNQVPQGGSSGAVSSSSAQPQGGFSGFFGGTQQQSQGFIRRLFGGTQQQSQGGSSGAVSSSGAQPQGGFSGLFGGFQQQSQGGFSGVIPSSGAQPQGGFSGLFGGFQQPTRADQEKAKKSWENAMKEAEKECHGPKVVNAASASLDINRTIAKGSLVFGGKRLSEQDKYSLELKALQKIHYTDFYGAPDDLKSNRDFMLKAVAIKPDILEYASEELLSDREIVLAAVKKNGSALQYACEDLRRDKKVVMEAVRQNGHALQYASKELRGDKEVVMEAVKFNGYALKYANEELKRDSKIVLAAVKKNGSALEYASKELRGDRRVVLEAVKQNGRVLQNASEELKRDPEIVLAAVGEYGDALQNASEELKRDSKIVLAAVKKNGSALEYACEDLRRDKKVVMEAVRQGSTWCLEYASEELRGDREVVLEAVKYNAFALSHASNTLQADKKVVLEAVKYSGFALRFASNTLQADKEVVMAALKKYGSALEFASEELRGERDFVMEAVKQTGYALQYASEELRGDKEVVMAAVKQNGWALEYASKELRGDRRVVLEAVKQNFSALRYASNTLQAEMDVLEAVKKNDSALRYASNTLQAEMGLSQNRTNLVNRTSKFQTLFFD